MDLLALLQKKKKKEKKKLPDMTSKREFLQSFLKYPKLSRYANSKTMI